MREFIEAVKIEPRILWLMSMLFMGVAVYLLDRLDGGL